MIDLISRYRFTLKIVVLLSFSLSAPLSYSAKSSLCELSLIDLSKEVPEKDTFVWDVSKRPLLHYKILERAFFEKKESFSYVQQKPVLYRILSDLEHRLQKDSVLELPQFEEDYHALTELRTRLLTLFSKELPYHEVVDFVISWVETMKRLLQKTDPHFPSGTYHHDIAGPELQKIKDPSKHSYIFFSFESVDDEYFWKIRPAPIYLHGLLPIPRFTVNKSNYKGGALIPTEKTSLYIDGYVVNFDEFTKHDAGHSAFMQRRDVWLFETEQQSREKQVAHWDYNKNYILKQISYLAPNAPRLAEAIRLMITEIIHERGYQYHLPILRQQLVTTKWVDVVRKKLQNKYWQEPSIDLSEASLLDTARVWLLNLVEQMTVDLFLKNVGKFHARNHEVRIVRWMPIATYQGRPMKIEVGDASNEKRVWVTFDVQGKAVKTSLYEVSLAQISVGSFPITDPLHLDLVRRLKADPSESRLSNTEIFKIEQIFTLMANPYGKTEFTITPEPESFYGSVGDINLKAGTVEVRSEDEVNIYPIVELSVRGPVRKKN